MHKKLVEVLRENRDDIARQWAERVSESSDHYRRQPLAEIENTARALIDGLVEAVTLGNFERIESVLKEVARGRAAQGFGPTEVQRALLMGCDAIFPACEAEFGGDAAQLVWSVTQIERAVHRGLSLLNKAFEEVRTEILENETRLAEARAETAEGRLQAILGALGYGAIAVNRDLVVLWVDDVAGSARCGAVAPGDVHACRPAQPEAQCLLTKAIETGEIQRGEKIDECTVWLAIPIKSAGGEITEAIGVMGV